MNMKKIAFWMLFLIIGCFWGTVGLAEQIQLVGNDDTTYRIMLAPGASPVEEFAAQELQGYIMQVSNVFLPMAARNEPARGKLVLVGKAAVKAGLDIGNYNLKPDGFVIKTMDERLILAGGSSRGTLYSVYAFLEMLGCRWLAPGILGEIIPRRATIVIDPIDRCENPDIAHRGFTNLIPVTYESIKWIDWMAKNKMNYLMIPRSNYSDFRDIMGDALERYGIDAGVKFDESTAADEISGFISDNPEVDIVALYAGSSHEKTISLIEPGQKEPGRCYRHSVGDEQCEINNAVREHLKDALNLHDKIHIYEYYMGTYSQNSLPFPVLHTIMLDVEYLATLDGVDGVISQCEPGNWGAYGLQYYVFARAAWNTDSDLGSIVDDYCEKYYGPASEPMKKYFSILEDNMTAQEHFKYVDPPELVLNLLNEESITEMETALINAQKLSSDAMTFDRLRKTELSLDHAKLLWRMLNHYSRGVQLQEAKEDKEAETNFQQAIELGEKLVAFLFQNIDEEVYIIPESYIFDYLEPIIMDARTRKDQLETN